MIGRILFEFIVPICLIVALVAMLWRWIWVKYGTPAIKDINNIRKKNREYQELYNEEDEYTAQEGLHTHNKTQDQHQPDGSPVLDDGDPHVADR